MAALEGFKSYVLAETRASSGDEPNWDLGGYCDLRSCRARGRFAWDFLSFVFGVMCIKDMQLMYCSSNRKVSELECSVKKLHCFQFFSSLTIALAVALRNPLLCPSC